MHGKPVSQLNNDRWLPAQRRGALETRHDLVEGGRPPEAIEQAVDRHDSLLTAAPHKASRGQPASSPMDVQDMVFRR